MRRAEAGPAPPAPPPLSPAPGCTRSSSSRCFSLPFTAAGGVAEALGNLGVRLFKPLAIGGNRRRLAVDRASGDAEEHRRPNLARDRRSLTQWRI